MALWIALGLSALLLAVLLSVPIRLRINLQGRGEPTGEWALAGGVQSGPVVWSAVAADGVELRSQLRVFGKELPFGGKGTKKPERSEEDEKEEAEPDQAPFASAKKGYERVARWVDPVELVLFLVRERRRIEFGLIEVTLDYSFEDVALTGKIQGALYVLGGMFQDRVRIMQIVSWESSDRAKALLSGEITLWPGRALVDTALFMVRHGKLRSQRPTKKLGGSRQ